MIVVIATSSGLAIAAGYERNLKIVKRSLSGVAVNSLTGREGVLLAGTRQGIYRSEDNGQSWRPSHAGLTSTHVRQLAFHPQASDLEFAGTEPADIFMSIDGGRTWASRPEVARLRDVHGWYLFYSPEAGCIRSFAFQGLRGYAAVEVGGLLRSADGGVNWDLAPGNNGDPKHHARTAIRLHPDVHDIAVHPDSEDLVYAATGGGPIFRRTEEKPGHKFTRPIHDPSGSTTRTPGIF